MRVVVVSDWFSETMGYSENFLPKALAAQGAEVHVVTSDVQTYFDSPLYAETYEPFLGPGVVSCGVKLLDGYTLHRLPHARRRGRLRIKGLLRYVRTLRPDVVQTFDTHCPSTNELTLAKPFLGYRLFHESSLHASVFPPATRQLAVSERAKWFTYASTMGRLVSAVAERCYPVSSDAADIVVRFFGFQPGKIRICSLGVDTDLFVPPDTPDLLNERERVRHELGFSPDDVVCVYSGRFSTDKGPIVLANAVDRLADAGSAARGLFVGSGSEEAVQAIKACRGCVVHEFVPVRDLPRYYRAADIGVWPKQESTSQLDAAACGLPLILSDRVAVRERVDGNGLVYAEGDAGDLAKQVSLLLDSALRQEMGRRSAEKVRENFSWARIARERLDDYEAALARQRG